uniref:Replication-associated protein n=1 Tax=Red panda feces-associated circular DNA virus 6 TaxID=2863981 RepID=A0A8K1HKS2_9VIRU|nr:replication-associated protein [Red panda feces-associated circular DNA virus 6]
MAARAWCFTLNNPQSNEINWASVPNVRYAIWQRERGSCVHLQGYVELDRPGRFSMFKSMLPGAHFEPRRGSREQARDYCKKNDDTYVDGPWEYGDWQAGGQGKRKDLDDLEVLLKEGKTETEIKDTNFGIWAKHYKVIERYKLLESKNQRSEKTRVVVIVGPPGCGKSRKCLEDLPNAYWKSPNEWWCGYNGTDPVVLDDFYGWMPFSQLLRIMDRYPVQCNTKGGSVNFNAKTLYITSNVEPGLWYKDSKLDIRALRRRIDEYWNTENDVLVNKSCLLNY